MARTLDSAIALASRAWAQPESLGDGDCEELRSGLIGQPVNTASSLGYVAVGGWLLARSTRLPLGSRTTARWYAAFVALTGAGSVAYHGPQFAGAQLLHDLPIVGVIGIGVGVPVLRRLRRDPVVVPRSARRVGAAAGLGVLGGLAYLGGRTTATTCDPASLLQWHGAWHLCTAAAAGLWATALWPLLDDSTRARGERAVGVPSEGAS